MISAKYRLFRGKHAVRLRGSHPTTGTRVDTVTTIPREVFDGAGVNPNARGKRAQDAVRMVGEQYAARLIAKLNSPTAKAPDEMTIRQLWELYSRRQKSQLNPATINRARKYVARLVQFFDVRMQAAPSKISLGGFEEYRDWRLSDGRSPATIWRELGFLRQLLRWALAHSDETGVRSIAVDRLPTVKGKRGIRPKRALTAEEFFRLYDATFKLPRSGDVLRRILVFGVCTRLRKTPLLAMRGEFVDRGETWLRVPATLNKGKGDSYTEISLPLPRRALAALADLPRHGLLWPSAGNTPHDPDDADAMLTAARGVGILPLRDSVLVALAVRYRIRADDIAGLTWERVNLDAGTIGPVYVRRNIVTVTLAADDLAALRTLRRDLAVRFVFPSDQRAGKSISKRIVFRVVARASKRAIRGAASMAERPMLWLDSSLKKLCRLADVAPISLHDLRRTGNTWLLSHRCDTHTGPVEEIIRERLLCHVPRELAAAYNFMDDDVLREAIERYDCIFDEHERRSGVVQIAPRRAAR